jgi:ABC-type taurine transport system substrate-binding protein
MLLRQYRTKIILLGLLLTTDLIATCLNSSVIPAYAQSASSTAEDAVQLIRNYYRWINQKKYQGAFNIWEKREDGYAVNGQSFETFAGGFSDTASASVEIGVPGEIEGAAGSNYIQIPVVISATSTDGSQQKFAGTYTMRSSNMADDKSWYINSAKVRMVE